MRARGRRHRLRVLFHLLWAAGVTWGLEEMFPGGQTDASLSLTAASLVGAVAGAAVIFVRLGRVGWLETPLSDRLLHMVPGSCSRGRRSGR